MIKTLLAVLLGGAAAVAQPPDIRVIQVTQEHCDLWRRQGALFAIASCKPYAMVSAKAARMEVIGFEVWLVVRDPDGGERTMRTFASVDLQSRWATAAFSDVDKAVVVSAAAVPMIASGDPGIWKGEQ